MSILLFIVVLSTIVILHELGHFLTARRAGVHVEEFGLGFPPRITGKRIGNVLYTLNWIPFGGFVRLKGEGGDHADDEDSFVHKTIPRRALILVAGVAVNFLLSAMLLIVGFWTGLPSLIDENLPASAKTSDTQVQIVSIEDDSPASRSMLAAGDIVRTINGSTIIHIADLRAITAQNIGQSVTVTVDRDGVSQEVTTAVQEKSGEAQIGIGLIETGLVRYPFFEAIGRGLLQTVDFTWQILTSFGRLIRDLVVTHSISADIAGPVGIAALTGRIAGLGFQYLLQFIAVLSLSLAIINVLPLPALDGGRIFFLLIEKIRGRAVSQRVEGYIHGFGFYVLLLFVIVVSVRDFSRFGIGDAIASFFRGIF